MEFLEVPLYDDDLLKLIVRLSINLCFLVLLVRFCYYRHQNDKIYVFTFLLMNILIFFICFALKKLDLGLGMALGLFAIFGIIRFRTDAMPVKEMTYLFIVIGLAVINALSNKQTSYAELLFTNLLIIGATFLLERLIISSNHKIHKVVEAGAKIKKQAAEKKTKFESREFVYDQMELLRPERAGDLLVDLSKRTGANVDQVKIINVDFASRSALVSVRYVTPKKPPGEEFI